MTTLTIEIPDNQTADVSRIIKKKGGNIIANSKEFTKEEQLSINQGLKEAELIKSGAIKGLTFDELWND